MRLWKMEFYKIAARPVMNIGFLLVVGFFLLVLWQEADGTRTEIDGKVYQGLEAVAKDRQLAKEYEGRFTMEKAEDIVERFGFSGYEGKSGEGFSNAREGNFCSQFVTDAMTDFLQTQERPLGFSTGEAWENYGKRYVEGKILFGYTQGWKELQQVWYMAMVSLHVWLALMIAPVFSEEYSRKVTGILLSTAFGKSKDIFRKVEAAMGLGILSYLFVCVLLFGMTAVVYGVDGLGASAGINSSFLVVSGRGDWSISFFFFFMFLSGLASVLLNVGIVLFVSSKCSRPVSAVTAGILLYLLPYGLNQILFQMLLSMGAANNPLGWRVMDAMRIFCFSMPMYLPHPDLFYIPVRWAAYIPLITVVAMIWCIWRGCRNYRGYEEA